MPRAVCDRDALPRLAKPAQHSCVCGWRCTDVYTKTGAPVPERQRAAELRGARHALRLPQDARRERRRETFHERHRCGDELELRSPRCELRAAPHLALPSNFRVLEKCAHSSRLAVENDPAVVRRALEWLEIPPSRYHISEQEAHSPPPNCADYPVFPEHPSLETQIGSSGHRASTTGQVESRFRCHELISRHERETGTLFDWVLFARPDLLWFRSVYPWCTVEQAVEWGARRIDWAFLVTREAARLALVAPYEAYFNCSAPFLLTDNQESWEARHVWARDSIREAPSLLPGYLVRDGFRRDNPTFSCGEIDFRGSSLGAPGSRPMNNYCATLANENSCNAEAA